MNLFDGREGMEKSWLLPPWGHLLGLAVYPLFIEVDGRVKPIGTAFNVGGGVNITITAFHCVEEAIRLDPKLNRVLTNGGVLKDGTLERCGLYVLRNFRTDEGIQFSFVPLEHVSGGPPADVVFCAVRFSQGQPAIGTKLSFALPEPGDLVHSVGYCNVRFPEEWISLQDAPNFDWANDYSHDFRVIESEIGHIFLKEYARSYLRGPCFSFSGKLESGMSGGPIFDLQRGVVFGVNSASGFDLNTALGSLLYPYVLNKITFGANVASNFRLNATQHIIHMLEFGSIASDGTHELLAFSDTPEGPAVAMPIQKTYAGRVFDDLAGLQAGSPPSRDDGPRYRRVRANLETPSTDGSDL